MTRPRYQVVEHTADFAFRVTAASLPDLVQAAILAVVDAGWGIETLRPAGTLTPVDLPVDDAEMTLFRALSEVLFLIDARGLIPAAVTVTPAASGGLSLRLDCDRLDPARHGHRVAFKAVTLHGLNVVAGGEGLVATVLMDT